MGKGASICFLQQYMIRRYQQQSQTNTKQNLSTPQTTLNQKQKTGKPQWPLPFPFPFPSSLLSTSMCFRLSQSWCISSTLMLVPCYASMPREFVATNEVKENGFVNNYGLSEQQMQQVHGAERIQEDDIDVAKESHGSPQPTVNAVQDHVPTAEEPPVEPQKHTYASILRVAKGQSTPSVASQQSQKNVSSLECGHAPPTSIQQTTASTNTFER